MFETWTPAVFSDTYSWGADLAVGPARRPGRAPRPLAV
jgi:hypothetical protein